MEEILTEEEILTTMRVLRRLRGLVRAGHSRSVDN